MREHEVINQLSGTRLIDSASIRTRVTLECGGNKDQMIGVLAMELALECDKNAQSHQRIENPPDDLNHDPEYYRLACELITSYSLNEKALPLAYRVVQAEALLDLCQKVSSTAIEMPF